MDIYKKALEVLEAGRPFALAAVIESSGSTPQKAGAKAVFEGAGPIYGTLGGGCLEAESRLRALQSLDDGAPLAFDLKLDEVKGWDDGLICGGKVRVFVDPDIRKNIEAYRAAIDAHAQGKRGVLVTVVSHHVHAPGTALWMPEASFWGNTLADGEALRVFLDSGKAGRLHETTEEGSLELFVEPVGPPPKLIIAGAGHIGRATAHYGALLGFEVTIIDDRPSLAHSNNVSDAHHCICGDIPKEMAAQPISDDTYIVIVTRGHRHDGAVLAACVKSNAAYIGMIGSRRKSLLIRRSLVEEGLATQDEIDRVVSPIGLDIGGESVQEIAVSIAAQLVAVRRKKGLQAGAMSYAGL